MELGAEDGCAGLTYHLSLESLVEWKVLPKEGRLPSQDTCIKYDQAADSGEAVAILNHNKPAGYIVSPRMMEALLDAIADRVAEDRAKSRLTSLSLARKISLDDL
jgi:PHD/YefM family antitoxin component YafN of YafNO toxin-antitoxin module